MGLGKCQYCGRPTATDICPAHGFVGNVREKEADKIPIGLIALWSGTVATIPHSWALCDGTLGTPDLRDKFILGGGSTAPGTTGGSNAAHGHTLTVTVSETSTGGHDHTGGVTSYYGSSDTVGAHSHGAYSGNTGTPDTYSSNPRGTGTDINYTNQYHYHSMAHTHSNDGGHYHSLNHGHGFVSPAAAVDHNHSPSITGASATTAGSMPAYYTLAYIMKVGG